MSEQANMAATQKLFEAFGGGDIPAILDFLNDDIVIEFYGPRTARTARQHFFKNFKNSVFSLGDIILLFLFF